MPVSAFALLSTRNHKLLTGLCDPRSDAQPRRFNGKCKCGVKASTMLLRRYPRLSVPGFDYYTDESGMVYVDNTCGDGPLIQCDCGKFFRLKPVLGKYSDRIKCDGRCEGATGQQCECQCGGKNHGRAHSI